MKRALSLFLLILLVLPYSFEKNDMPSTEVRKETDNVRNVPLFGDFLVENRGQLHDDEILYYYPGDPFVGLRSDGLIASTMNGPTYRMSIRDPLTFSDIDASEEGPVLNFIYGHDRDDWFFDVPTYEMVTLQNIRRGTDLSVIMTEEGPKWEIHLDKGFRAEDLVLEYHGEFDRSNFEDGILYFNNDQGQIREGPFDCFQNDRLIEDFVYFESGSIRFDTVRIDPEKPVLIDPLMNSSTFFGGTLWDTAGRVRTHPSGDIFLAGTVESANIQTPGSTFDPTQNGEDDVFICRMTADLSTLISGTYIGGDQNDRISDIFIGEDEQIYLSGRTASTNFPVTEGAFQTTYQGGTLDGFAIKLPPSLNSLSFSTFIGGSDKEDVRGIAVDEFGNPHVTGNSWSDDMPVTTGCYQDALKGEVDAFVAKFDPQAKNLTYLTYLGSTNFANDDANDIRIDSQNRAVIAGYSGSSDFPTTEGVYKNGSGEYMGYVSRFSVDGTELNMSTFLAFGTRILAFVLDENDNIYMTGRTESISGMFPVSSDAFDKDLSGVMDGFISVMDKDGTNVTASTYIGADEYYAQPPDVIYAEEYCTDITFDRNGDIVICGSTDSKRFPMTRDAMDIDRNYTEAFILQINRNLTTLLFSTFVGSYEEDRGYSVAVDENGWLYLSGHTYSDQDFHDFPVTEGAYQTTHPGQYDWFCTRFKMDSFLPGRPVNIDSSQTNNSINITWEPPLFDGNEDIIDYHIYWGTTPQVGKFLNTTENLWINHTNLTKGRRYYYKVHANNKVGLGLPAETNNRPVSVPVEPLLLGIDSGDSHINVSWYPPWDTGGHPIIEYEMRYGTDPDYLNTSVMGINTTWLDVTGLTNGITYHFQIYARNQVGWGPGSLIKNGTPFAIPTPPRNLVATTDDRTVFLSWDEPLDKGGAGNVTYNVYRVSNESYPIAIFLGHAGTSVSVFPLLNGKEYSFYVVAENSIGVSERSNIVSARPLGPISEPLDLRGTEHGDRVDLSWIRPFDTGGIENITYSVFMGTDIHNLSVVLEGFTGNTTSVHDLTPGTTYHFAVMAENGLFNSTLSNIVTLTPLEVPTAVRNLSGEAGDSFVNITWERPDYLGGDEEVSYTVYTGPSIPDIYARTTIKENYFNITDLRNGDHMVIFVRARNTKGYGPFSSVLNLTPLAVPTEPRFLTYTDGDGELFVSWDVPFDLGGVDTVTYELFMGADEKNLSLFKGDLNTRNITVRDLENGRSYFIGVRAVNAKGPSPMAGPIEAVPMTFPDPPVISSIMEMEEALVIEWDPPADNGGSGVWYYHLKRTDEEGISTTVSTGGTVNRYVDRDVIRGINYTYIIKAETSYGVSGWSDPYSMEFPREEEEEELPVDLVIAIIAATVVISIILILILVAVSRSRRRKRDRTMWEE